VSENTGNSGESALSIFDARAALSGFMERRVGRESLREPARLSEEKNSAVGRRFPTTRGAGEGGGGRQGLDGRRKRRQANNYPAGTYVNGEELINLEFSFVQRTRTEKLARAYRLITGLDEISAETSQAPCNVHDIARNDTNYLNLISRLCLFLNLASAIAKGGRRERERERERKLRGAPPL